MVLMVDQQPETGETPGEAFDRWLIEALPADFEEFLAEAPQLLAKKPVEFLRDCKARVDARLAAEPEKNVFSISGPHEVRLLYWDKIADRLEAEINWLSGKSADTAGNSVRSTRGGDPEVAKRRSIVKANRAKSAEELCKRFDFDSVRRGPAAASRARISEGSAIDDLCRIDGRAAATMIILVA
jgi:hypothetical protein